MIRYVGGGALIPNPSPTRGGELRGVPRLAEYRAEALTLSIPDVGRAADGPELTRNTF